VAADQPVNRLAAALARLVGDVGRHGRKGALVGGLAVSTRAEPRLTRDVDLAVAVAGDAEAEALVRALVADGYSALTVVEQEATRRLATVRFSFPGETARGVVADLLFASSGIESIVVAEAEPLEIFPGVSLPVARIGHLIALKLLSRDDRTRPQDTVDLRALFKIASQPELERSRVALMAIERAGFARGRDLQAALAEWISTDPAM
jgi:predicted nucleotidyltransferase